MLGFISLFSQHCNDGFIGWTRRQGQYLSVLVEGGGGGGGGTLP